MEPVAIVEKSQIVLAGFSFFGDPFSLSGEWTEENEIGRLWSRLMAFLTQHGDRLNHLKQPSTGYEVHLEHAETPHKGHFEVFVGLEIDQVADVPVELVVKILPAATYAVFTLAGEQILSDWPRQIYHDWLPGSGYQPAYNFSFQFYDARFKGMDQLAESVIDVYVPIK